MNSTPQASPSSDPSSASPDHGRSHQDNLPYYILQSASPDSFLLPVLISPAADTTLPALVDSGASTIFVDINIATHFKTTPLPTPIPLHMFDGSPSSSGRLTHTAEIPVTFSDGTHQTLTSDPRAKAEQELLEKVVPPQFREFADVFSESAAIPLPPHQPYDHTIEFLDPVTKIPWGPIYNMSELELTTLREYIEDNLAKGFIRPSQSPAGARVLFAKKKDGSLQLCVDYRGLNVSRTVVGKRRRPWVEMIREEKLKIGLPLSVKHVRDDSGVW